jgi:hypothetical protein
MITRHFICIEAGPDDAEESIIYPLEGDGYMAREEALAKRKELIKEGVGVDKIVYMMTQQDALPELEDLKL